MFHLAENSIRENKKRWGMCFTRMNHETRDCNTEPFISTILIFSYIQVTNLNSANFNR